MVTHSISPLSRQQIARLHRQCKQRYNISLQYAEEENSQSWLTAPLWLQRIRSKDTRCRRPKWSRGKSYDHDRQSGRSHGRVNTQSQKLKCLLKTIANLKQSGHHSGPKQVEWQRIVDSLFHLTSWSRYVHCTWLGPWVVLNAKTRPRIEGDENCCRHDKAL